MLHRNNSSSTTNEHATARAGSGRSNSLEQVSDRPYWLLLACRDCVTPDVLAAADDDDDLVGFQQLPPEEKARVLKAFDDGAVPTKQQEVNINHCACWYGAWHAGGMQCVRQGDCPVDACHLLMSCVGYAAQSCARRNCLTFGHHDQACLEKCW